MPIFRLLLVAGCLLPGIARAQQDNGAAPPPPPRPGGLDDPAFRAAMQGEIPLTREMILELGRRFRENQDAREQVVAPRIATPATRSVNMSIAPGSSVPIIEVQQGYPTALAFVDSTGQPWPIAWDTNSNPSDGGTAQAAVVQAIGSEVRVPIKGGNVLTIAPTSSAPRGGLLVTLQGASAPLSFIIASPGNRFDARVDVRVADRGPNAKVQIITRPNTPETGAAYLTAMLDGAPPAQAVPLTISGVSPDDVRAWRLGERVYLRTQYTLLSPEWTASESGQGGMTIYALPSTPVVLLSTRGRSVAARLSE